VSAHAGSAHAGAGAGARIVVVGIGADGWPGLSALAREAILSADEVIGSRRQLELLPGDGPGGRPWPSPIGPLIDELVLRATGSVCVPASGDPMLHGVGATLAGRVPAGRLSVISHPSAFSLACARLGWPAGRRGRAGQRRLATGRRVARILQPGRRALAARSLTSASAALTPNSSPLTAPPRCDRGTQAALRWYAHFEGVRSACLRAQAASLWGECFHDSRAPGPDESYGETLSEYRGRPLARAHLSSLHAAMSISLTVRQTADRRTPSPRTRAHPT